MPGQPTLLGYMNQSSPHTHLLSHLPGSNHPSHDTRLWHLPRIPIRRNRMYHIPGMLHHLGHILPRDNHSLLLHHKPGILVMHYLRQALGFAHPPTIGFLTNQLLGILPTTNQLLGILPINYWVSYQPSIDWVYYPQLQSNNKQTNKGFFERWLKWSGITYPKGSNRQWKRVLKSKTWPDLSSLMRGCTRQPRKGQNLLSIFPPLAIHVQVQHSIYQFPPPLAIHAFNELGSSIIFLLSIFPPPLAIHAFNESGSNTTFLLSISPPLGNPCF